MSEFNAEKTLFARISNASSKMISKRSALDPK